MFSSHRQAGLEDSKLFWNSKLSWTANQHLEFVEQVISYYALCCATNQKYCKNGTQSV